MNAGRGNGGVRNGKTGPHPEAIKAATERVASSRALAGSDQLQRFLRYVVGEELAGRGGDLKESVLGVEVFDRGAGYDPRTDPIVRVQARRLRARLEEYYRDEGSAETVRIELPKGSYVPAFALGLQSASPAARSTNRSWIWIAAGLALIAGGLVWREAAATSGKTVAVLPLVNLTGDPSQEWMADKLTEGLITELARRKELQVRSRTTVMQYKGTRRPLREIARELDVAAVFEGGVSIEGGRVMVKARVVDARADAKVWADTFERPEDELGRLPAEIGARVAEILLRR